MVSRISTLITPTSLATLLAFLVSGCSGSTTPANEGVGGTPITGTGGTSSGTTLATGGSSASGGNSSGGTATSTRNTGGTTASTGTAQTGGKATSTSGGAAGSAGRGGAGTGGSRGGAGGASGGIGGSGGVTTTTGGSTTTTTATSCSNGVKDGSESGIDCGGSCAPCVTYALGTPKVDDTVRNACESNGTGYICPRFMLFSPEMIQAAKDDAAANSWPGDAFNYGVATLDGEACCSCFQVVYDKPTHLKTTITPPKSLVVQMFNTGAGGHVDVFMGKGGMGAFQEGCPRMYTTFPMTGENPWMGGIRASNISACGTEASALSSATCVSAIQSECDKIQSTSAAVTTTTQTSCVRANSAESYYHENWNVRVRKIACPTHLTEVTGCKPNDDASLPKADPKVQTASQATGTGWQDKQSTSMQDCCKPSCSWSGKTSNMKAGWGAMYTCNQSGVPMTQ